MTRDKVNDYDREEREEQHEEPPSVELTTIMGYALIVVAILLILALFF